MASNFWEGKNVFVTGANGFLGSWLSIELANRGARVVGLVRDWLPKSLLVSEGWYEKVNLVRGDLSDHNLLDRAISDYAIDTCFHIGAQTQVTTAFNSPLQTFEANIRGTYNVLEACRNNKSVKRVIVASTDKSYGSSLKLPYREEDPLLGVYPYDVSKVCADILSRSYYVSYQLPVTVTRLSNIYGGGDLNPDRLIPTVCLKILNNESPVIYGDGSVVRDFIYVEDAVDGYLNLAENLDRRDVMGQAFNFGNHSPISVLGLINLILKVTKRKDLKPIFEKERVMDIKEQYLSFEKAKNVLGWEPRTSMEEGLRKTYEWYGRYKQSLWEQEISLKNTLIQSH